MNKYTTKINSITIILLILSLVFIIPMNTQNVFAAEGEEEKTKTSTNEQVQQDCGIFPPLNVKDSIILSAATLCLPGLLEKANEYRQIKCQEVVCEYNAVVNSISPTYCKKQGAYRTCKYVVGEFTSLPYLNLIDTARSAIADIIANPAGYLYSVSIALLRPYVTDCYIAGCDSTVFGAGAIVLAINDIAAGAQTIIDIIDNGFFPDFNTDDYCDQIEDIKTELELVIAGTTTETPETPTPTPSNSSTPQNSS